jgi:hypothetical protein
MYDPVVDLLNCLKSSVLKSLQDNLLSNEKIIEAVKGLNPNALL